MLVNDAFGQRPVRGEVGIEVEVEGYHLPQKLKGWRIEEDHSLRGESLEYISEEPRFKEEAFKDLDRLYKRLKKGGTEIYDSERAGVHVHMNMTPYNVMEGFSIVLVYYLLEESLIRWCGTSRVGNLFCLSTRDASGVLLAIENFLKGGPGLRDDNIRYASCNLRALPTYGSIEFRSLRTPQDVTVIKTWIEILLKIRDFGLSLRSPKDLLLYQEDLHALINTVLGEHCGAVKEDGDWKAHIKGAYRRILFLLVEINWSNWNFRIEPREDV